MPAPDALADAERILRAAIAAADPAPATRTALQKHDVSSPRRILVVAVGKAAGTMMHAALHHLHALRDAYTVHCITVVPHGVSVTAADAPVRVLHAAHPLPDLSSVAAARVITDAVTELEPADLLLVLLSGGASSLITDPIDDVTITALAHCIDLLMRAGADIHQLNCVRRALDRLKGGGLARLADCRVLGLVLSDVPGSPLHDIGSGPLTPSPTDAADAVHVLRATGVWDQCAPAIREALAQQVGEPPFPVPDDVVVEVIADSRTAVTGAAIRARELGYTVRVEEEPMTGDASVVGRRLAALAVDAAAHDERRLCIVAGGETVVTVRGSGTGGRNQELVLAGALALPDGDRITIGAIGTDGVDGPTAAAGAACDGAALTLYGRARAEAALHDNDSGTLLTELGRTIVTGPTGTNVADVAIVLVP